MPRWMIYSALSGCGWGFLAFCLMDARTNPGVLGACASAPVIGLGMGVLSRGFRALSLLERAFITVVSVYLAVALFGLAGGFSQMVFGFQPARSASPLGWMAATVVGVTVMGYVFFLVPLAYVNHLLVDASGWGDDV